jgi:trans-aconitate 2-methyltransferase
VDASASLVASARERLSEFERAGTLAEDRARRGARSRGRVDIRVGDLLELDLGEPVDAVLSTATFHWISDHERLFASLHAALRPGGQLVAQCGGEGNIDVLRGTVNVLLAEDPYAEHFRGWRAPWNYAGAEETQRRLLAAGFHAAECWLMPAPKQPEHAREFLSTIVLGPHVQRLPDALREPFMNDVLAALPDPVVVDYVRLNIKATA